MHNYQVSNLAMQYNREDRCGAVIVEIAEREDILLSEAMGIYLEYPELQEHLMNDDYEDIMDDEYLSQLIQDIIYS